MQPIGADRRPVAGLDEPAFDSAILERAASVDQKQPGVLTDRVGSSVPCIAVLGQEAEPRPQHREIRVARPRRANTTHEAVPLVERNDELTIGIEDQPLVDGSTRRVRELSREPQRTGAVQAAELAARTSLGTHDRAANRSSSSYVSVNRLSIYLSVYMTTRCTTVFDCTGRRRRLTSGSRKRAFPSG